MKSRVISGIVMALIIIPVLLIGGIVFDIAIGVLAAVAFKELIDTKKDVLVPNFMKIVGLVCMLMLTYVNIDGHTMIFGLSYETLSLVFILLLVPTIFLRKYKYSVNSAFYLSAIVIFLGTVFNLFITLFNESIYLFVFVILIACLTDIFALFGGKLIGKHPLTSISPKKTIEGSIVGTIVATIIATTYYVTLIGSISTIKIVFIIMLLSAIGQLGDLFFSLIKRENNIKDFSNLIPGHGGILDRIDSIIFILVAFVFMMQFL